MNKEQEKAYVLVGVLLLIMLFSALSIAFSYYIHREIDVINAQEDKLTTEFLLVGTERLIAQKLKTKAKENLARDSLTKQDLNMLKTRFNNQANTLNLAGRSFSYQLSELFDHQARINVNQCKTKDLEVLAGIAGTISQRIVDNRQYTQLVELKSIKGLAENRFRQIKDSLTVYGSQKINVNTADDITWQVINQNLDFRLSEYFLVEQRYSEIDDLIADIDDKAKQEKLRAKGEEIIKFNSDFIGVEYKIRDLKSDEMFRSRVTIKLNY